jgi:hypothetical protein
MCMCSYLIFINELWGDTALVSFLCSPVGMWVRTYSYSPQCRLSRGRLCSGTLSDHTSNIYPGKRLSRCNTLPPERIMSLVYFQSDP